MLRLHDTKFQLKEGVWVFPPNDASTAFGVDLCRWIERRWKGPDYYYHLRSGGHVAAVKQHLAGPLFLKLDLERFFDRVTRTKVARSLRQIGFRSRDAFEFACLSTVEKSPNSRAYSVPYGFVQSTLVASLALHCSALGKALAGLRAEGLVLSVYVDDILLSGERDRLEAALERLRPAAALAGFPLNEAKQQGPDAVVTAFNIQVRAGSLKIINDRMEQFEQAVLTGSRFQALGTIDYVARVNIAQAAQLRSLRSDL